MKRDNFQPSANSIPFDNTSTDLTSNTLQDVVIEVNTKANAGGGSSLNENKILTGHDFNILVDSKGNVLRGS